MADFPAMDVIDWRWAVVAGYLLVLGLLCVYGVHRYWLVWLYWRGRSERGTVAAAGVTADSQPRELPRVTVQVPLYNEPMVAARVIDAVASLDYPRERLDVQILDDSDEPGARIAAARVASWQAAGVDIIHLRREDRSGFKAGALAAGMRRAKGEFIAVFDADFVPPADFLRRGLAPFTDSCVGMVQGRWEHLNRDDSLLTQCQAVFLDAHFLIEQGGRAATGRWINFNGTAGLWRRAAIEEAGGWAHDTLTEDVDLSYRAQLAGWRLVFDPDLTCPAELPPEIAGFRSQQHRWSKGSIQTARKLLGRVLRSGAPLGVKVEAFFHLTGPMAYVYVTLLVLLLYPALAVGAQVPGGGAAAAVMVGASLFGLGTCSAGLFYVVGQWAQGKSVWRSLALLPVLMGLGVGIAVYNARGCLEALLGRASPFVRTPKYAAAGAAAPGGRRCFGPVGVHVAELVMGAYASGCAGLVLLRGEAPLSAAFLLIFAAGYFYVGVGGGAGRLGRGGSDGSKVTGEAGSRLNAAARG